MSIATKCTCGYSITDICTSSIEECKLLTPINMEKKNPISELLTPGAPTVTGTYFAIIKPYTGDEQQYCVLHYQAHKNLYRAAGHCFNIEVKKEDIVGYVGEVSTGRAHPGES